MKLVTIHGGKTLAVLAANVTDETVSLLEKILSRDDFVKFALQNKLKLHDKTILIRLALINLISNIPENEEIGKYKAALLRPHEFDDFLKQTMGDDIYDT